VTQNEKRTAPYINI